MLKTVISLKERIQLRSLLMTMLIGGAMMLPATSYATPTASEYGVVLNLSGKQRMLTQKMTKEVLLVTYGHEKDANIANLTATAELFDKTLKGLVSGSAELNLPPTTSDRILRQLNKVEGLWTEYQMAVNSVVANGMASDEELAKIAELNLPLLKQMNKAVVLYEKDASRGGLKASPELATAINLSGKQRMLTQKMTKEFFLIAIGHDVENNKLNLIETLTLFDRTLKGLKNGDETLGLAKTSDKATRMQLDKIAILWRPFKASMEKASGVASSDVTEEDIKKVAKNNLILLKEMNAAVKMYEQQAG